MLPVVFLALGPGEQGIFGVIIYHGGGEGVILIQPDGLPLHIGEDLIHVQREIRQMLPVRRAAGG